MLKNGHKKFLKTAAGAFLSFGGGFFLAGAELAGTAAFGEVALAGALGAPLAALVFMGAIIRCIFGGIVGKCIVKLGALAVILAVKLFTEERGSPVRCGIITGAATMLSGSAVSLLIGEFPEKLLFYALYASIAGLTSYSAAVIADDLTEHKVIVLRGTSGSACAVVYLVAAASLCGLSLPFINAGLTAAAFVTLCAAYFYGGIGGLMAGALGASGAFLASSVSGAAAAVLPLAGLVTGCLRAGHGRTKSFISAAFFVMAAFMTAVLMGIGEDILLTSAIIGGAAVFAVTAPFIVEHSDRIVDTGTEDNRELNRIALDFLSDSVEAVRQDAKRISEAFAAKHDRDRGLSSAENMVCGGCYRRGVCRGELAETAAELIPVIPESCIRKKEAAAEMTRQLKTRTAEKLMDMRRSGDRKLLDEQLRITGELLRRAGDSLEETGRYSELISRRIADCLESHGESPTCVIARYTASNRLTADIYFALSDKPEKPDRIRDLVNDVTGKKLMAASPVTSSAEMRISLYEKPSRSIEVYTASVTAEGSGISGDSSAAFTDSTGINYIVLSDGMGSGKDAAVESHMVVSLFRRLICSGMDAEAAAGLVNSVMVTKSRDESFATLDVLRIDCDICTVTSVKSGAAATMLRLGGEVMKLSAPTFPIGINETAEVSVAEHKISPGDMMIMFSDGISDSASLFIKELLLGGGSVREIVRTIAVKAEIFGQGSRTDDVTVIGILFS